MVLLQPRTILLPGELTNADNDDDDDDAVVENALMESGDKIMACSGR